MTEPLSDSDYTACCQLPGSSAGPVAEAHAFRPLQQPHASTQQHLHCTVFIWLQSCRSITEERTDAKYAISVSIVEIYNEMVHDLLAEEGKADPELQKGPAGFTIPDLTQSGEADEAMRTQSTQ